MKITRIFFASLNLLGQNFILLWPFFGLVTILVTMSLFFPEGATLGLNWRSTALLGAIMLMALAFMAGTFAMIHQAVLQQKAVLPLDKPESKPESATPDREKSPDLLPQNPFQSFFLLREFFPGLGHYFARFVLGALVHLGIILLLFVGFQAVVDANGGYPQALGALLGKLQSMDADPNVSLAQIQGYVAHLPVDVLARLNFLSLLMFGFIGLYGLLSLLTMLWPVFVVTHDIPVWQAYGKSLAQFFKDPLRLLFIGLFYAGLHLVLALLLASNNPLLESIRQLLVLLSDTWFVIVLFQYVLYFVPASQKPSDGVSLKA